MNKKVWVISIDEIPRYIVDTKEAAIAFIQTNIFPCHFYSKETETKIIATLDDDEFYDEINGNYAINEVLYEN